MIIAVIKSCAHYLKTVLLWRFFPKRFSSKVFVIGYNKTGTTSVGESLKLLGFKHTSFNKFVWRKLYNEGRIKETLDYMSRYDSADDLPWLKEEMIPILNETFPNSRFIYLTRDEASWKRSYKDWSLFHHGIMVDTEKGWEDYQKHARFVQEFLNTQIPKNNWISLEVKDPLGLLKLAEFLGKEAPAKRFPRKNATNRLPKL